GQQAGFGHRIVEAHRRGDRHRINLRIGQDAVEAGRTFHLRIELMEVAEALLIQVAHRLEATIRQRPEITNEIGPPIPAADDGDGDVLGHFYVYLPGSGGRALTSDSPTSRRRGAGSPVPSGRWALLSPSPSPRGCGGQRPAGELAWPAFRALARPA